MSDIETNQDIIEDTTIVKKLNNCSMNEKVSEEKDIIVQIAQIPWDKTPNFIKNGGYATIKSQCESICGDTVFGIKKGCVQLGIKSVISFIERVNDMDVFKFIPSGIIVKNAPTRKEMVDKLQMLSTRAIHYYNKYPQTLVTDNWVKQTNIKEGSPMNRSIPLQCRIMALSGKRFTGKNVSVVSQVTDLIKSSRGILAEGHVIAFLNSGFKCPTCKVIGRIGWCDGITNYSVDSFRDAVCMNCRDHGKITLFEIKTRWEHAIKDNGTYAGNFCAINTLMTLKANVYLVIASRDTGDIRVGKITSAKMRGNKNWLYSLQEDLGWGSPSSYVLCEDGLHKLPVQMPFLIKTMPNSYCEEIFNEVLETAEWNKN
jgi:hypothetical protein